MDQSRHISSFLPCFYLSPALMLLSFTNVGEPTTLFALIGELGITATPSASFLATRATSSSYSPFLTACSYFCYLTEPRCCP